MNKIWQRYFLLEFLKVFFLFIASFYFIYILIDYSVHTKDFQNDRISWAHILAYYGCQFAHRGEILIPVAILIATIKVLTTSNLRHEIAALVTGGIPLKKLLSPFLWAALGASFFLYFNFQWLQPLCLSQIESFEKECFKSKSKTEDKPVNVLVLEDSSVLLFQSFDPQKRCFFDIYWIKSSDHILKMESLFIDDHIHYGTKVDTICRSDDGEMTQIDSCEISLFPEMRFHLESLSHAVRPPRMQSLTQLIHTLGWKKMGFTKMSDRDAESASSLYFKLTVPLICFLAVLSPAPFCLSFSRTFSVYMIYALSIFGLVAFYTLINSSLILGKSQVIPPLISILLPYCILFLVLGLKYAKL